MRAIGQDGKRDIHAVLLGDRSDVQRSRFRTGNGRLLLIILESLSCKVCAPSLRNLQNNGCFDISETRYQLRHAYTVNVQTSRLPKRRWPWRTKSHSSHIKSATPGRKIDTATYNSLQQARCTRKFKQQFQRPDHSRESRTVIDHGQGVSPMVIRSKCGLTVPGVPLHNRTVCGRCHQSRRRPRR